MAINRIKDLERFDDLARIYVDPLVVLFRIAAGHLDMGPDVIDEEGNEVNLPVPPNERRLAAAELVNYRYPKLKATEHNLGTSQEGWAFAVIPPAPDQAASLPDARPAPLPDAPSTPSGPVEQPILAVDEFI